MSVAVHNIRREKLSLAEKVSRTAFFLYVIFMLVGAAPLQERDVNATTTSSPINQVVDSLIPLVSLLCLWPKRKTLLLLLKEEKYLTLFLMWCFASVFWSDFPLNSFKGWFRTFGSTIVVVALFLNLKSLDQALKPLKVVFAFYVLISLFAVAFIPYALQSEFPAWRGIAEHKNTLGQISLISCLVWAFAIYRPSAKTTRIVSFLFLFASLILLFGSRSTTSLIALLASLLIAFYLYVERQLRRLDLRRVVPLGMMGCFLILCLLVQAFDLDSITATFGKDTTFTGRDDIWTVLLGEVETHPILGCGFAGFWIAENPMVMRLWEDDEFSWHPNGGHEGYLDILNETGIIGLFLLTLMVTFYFRNLAKLRQPHFWKWFLISILIVNLTESTLFRLGSFSGWFFVCSYLALHVELIQSRTLEKSLGAAA